MSFPFQSNDLFPQYNQIFVSFELVLMTIPKLKQNAINVPDLVVDKSFVDAKRIIAMVQCR